MILIVFGNDVCVYYIYTYVMNESNVSIIYTTIRKFFVFLLSTID